MIDYVCRPRYTYCAGLASGQMAPGPSLSSVTELEAVEVVALLCSRQITARQYLTQLYEKLYSDGYHCLNAFQYVNVSQVRLCHSAYAQAATNCTYKLEALQALCYSSYMREALAQCSFKSSYTVQGSKSKKFPIILHLLIVVASAQL